MGPRRTPVSRASAAKAAAGRKNGSVDSFTADTQSQKRNCYSIAAIFQAFLYGVSLNNITIAAMAILLYAYALKDINREVEHARAMEIEHYKEEKAKEHALFEQTAEALASAIDAKDAYTHGHSTRVAMYSTQIALEAGKSDEECEKVYFAALLHDVEKSAFPMPLSTRMAS